jgi:uncharacterized membrane protein
VSLEILLIFVLLLYTAERRKEYGVRMGRRIEETEWERMAHGSKKRKEYIKENKLRTER